MHANQFTLKKFFLTILITQCVLAKAQTPADYFSNYNVVWNTQSTSSANSMPLAGSGVGCNVWVENGDLLIYGQQSGSYDKNGEYIKWGRFRIKFAPNLFAKGSFFKQEFKLKEGYILISGSSAASGSVTIRLWLEAKKPILHIEVNAAKEIGMTASYESWRFKDVVLAPEEKAATGRRSSIFDYDGYQVNVIKKGDVIEPGKNSLIWYQDNAQEMDAFQFALKTEGIENAKQNWWNPLQNLISGGMFKCPALTFTGTSEGTYFQTPYKAWNFTSTKKSKKFSLEIFGLVKKANTPAAWKAKLQSIANASVDASKAFLETTSWWKDFWNRSYIIINPDKDKTDNAWRIGRNFNLFRYQLGGNTYGSAPTKFNGGNLTTDAGHVKKDYPFDPDYRRWGGWSYTAANQELVYWGYLKNGDFDAMLPQFNVYKNGLINAEARTKIHFNHAGCSFAEQFQHSGMPVASHYGFTQNGFSFFIRPKETEKGELGNPWISTYYVGQLNFANMILEYQRFSNRDISAYIPFIISSLRFYDEHYQMIHKKNTGKALNEDGKLVIFPSTPSEHNLNSTNPADAIAAMISITKSMLALPQKMLLNVDRNYIQDFQKRIPGLPTKTEIIDGKEITFYSTSEKDGGNGNSQKPGLWTVFPTNLNSIGTPNHDLALNTWKYKVPEASKKEYIGWQRAVIHSARLGLTDEAKFTILKKLDDAGGSASDADGDRANNEVRFPSFWGPGYDWSPDHNWGGGGVIGLQDMLLQTQGIEIRILPTWPKEWDVVYKLHAPYNTTVEVVYKKGRLVNLKVTPKDREKDVIYEASK